MAASQYARMREATMDSLQEEEAVTVNTRALIDKVLARYSGEWTTLRELIQNAADARAKKVVIRLETSPSATVPLPASQDAREHLRHALLHCPLKTLLVSNDGDVFNETDWARLKRIAEGNPDETKIGAFGVGFYSVFADCETPFVASGNQSMAFYWKKDSLFTRRRQLPDAQQAEGTTFLLDYRSQSTPVPPLLGLCQFLATSLTFVGLECIELWVDAWEVMRLGKKMAPGQEVGIPREVNAKTKDGLMKIAGVEYQNAQIDARWMNVVGWNRTTAVPQTLAAPQQQQPQQSEGSLRSWFSRFTGGQAPSSSSSKRQQREEEALQQSLFQDLAGHSTATVFLRLSTVNVTTSVSRSLAAELERATKKPPPKSTRLAILTSSFAETAAATADGAAAGQSATIFASVLPSKTGKIFIGFPTAQTTGLLAHVSAPSVIPTVERESIDLNARYVRDWNTEMLRVAGIACRIAYTASMSDLRGQLERAAGGKRVRREDVDGLIPAAVHAFQQYSFEESTPSAKVGSIIEEAFWTCVKGASIDLLSTRGVLGSQHVRVASEDLSFVEGIPVVPDQVMEKAEPFITKLREFGLLSDITTSDIKKELEAQALSEKQVAELLKWACGKLSRDELDAPTVRMLFDGTVASVSEEFLAGAPSPVLQLGAVTSFVNVAKIPAEMPVPPTTIPFRLTKGLPLKQLESLGWDELQVVPWLRWILESDGQGFGAGSSLTASPAVAAQVLPVVSKAWDGLSNSSKATVVELLSQRTVMPTKLGMRRPGQAYFASVRLFEDLPTITGLQGVKERFLSALGVRKTVELNVVFDRLMAKSTSTEEAHAEGKWSHVDLIRYLLSVKDDIPADELKKLRSTPLCPAEVTAGDQKDKGKLHKLSDLYEPLDSHRVLGLPVLFWPAGGPWRPTSPEARFLKSLGLLPYPAADVLIGILAKTPTASQLHATTIAYFITKAYENGYNRFPMSAVQTAFLPVLPFEGEGRNLVAKPSQCYANPEAGVLRFRVLREDLRPHASLFGVAQDPAIDAVADKIVRNPPQETGRARVVFGYMANRLNEIGPNGNLAEKLGEAPIVPITAGRRDGGAVRMVSPRSVFLGDGETYGEIFDFVDFGPEANSFLLRVGAKHEPSAVELARMLVRQPGRLLDTLGTERYLALLRKVAESKEGLKRDKGLWAALRSGACLLAVNEVARNAAADEGRKVAGGAEGEEEEDEETFIKEYSLANAASMVIVDDFATYRLFQSSLLTAPQEEVLENFYADLQTPWLSRLVEDDQRMGTLLRDQSPAQKLQKLLVERCRLFLHDHTSEVIRHDARWLENNLTVKATEFLQITRRLRGYRMQFVERRTAALHRESKRDAVLYVTREYDLYEVSRAVMGLLLKRPRQQDFLALETILGSDLGRLRRKGYNVERILRVRAAEARVAEVEREKAEAERRRVEAERAKIARDTEEAATDGVKNLQIEQKQQGPVNGVPESPERALSMPGAFETPEPRPTSSGKGKKGVFGSITKALGMNPHAPSSGTSQSAAQQQMQSMLTHTPAPADHPPPYSAAGTSRHISTPGLGIEAVSSPSDLAQNLHSAITSSRPYNSQSLFNPPQTNQIKETPSYCDRKPGHDLLFLAELQSGIKIFKTRDNAQDPTAFLAHHRESLAMLAQLLLQLATEIFSLDPKTLNIFHDTAGSAIAFNTNGALFCNLRYFEQLHFEGMGSVQGAVEAGAYWWVTLCHELAHNLVAEHDSRHSFYTESFVGMGFGRMCGWVGRMTGAGVAV